MQHTIIINTTSIKFTIIIGNESGILFNSDNCDLPCSQKDLDEVLKYGLQKSMLDIGTVSRIAVNIGPSGLSAVRSGVAFANALSFSLNIPIFSYSSFELLGLQVSLPADSTLLCVSRASGENVYVGIYRMNKLEKILFGPPARIITEIELNGSNYYVAGSGRDNLVRFLPDCKLEESGIEYGNPEYLLTKGSFFSQCREKNVSGIVPITEKTGVINV